MSRDAAAIVANIRALHQPIPEGSGPCRADGSAWPCDAEYAARLLADTPSVEPAGLDEWMRGVVAAWREHWEHRDHRYGQDFAAFVGERLMTDYRLRDQEPYPFGHARLLPTQASDSPEPET